jgi:hypothetical protein
MVNPTLSSEMMLGSNHEGNYHSNQLLLLGSEAGASHGWDTARFLVRRGEASGDPDELIGQLILRAEGGAYP